MVTEYCQTADDLPMLITDILGRLVDLLKVYDSTHNISRGDTPLPPFSFSIHIHVS